MKSLLAAAILLIVSGLAQAQTASNPQVWSCNTGCNLNGDTYSDGAWRNANQLPSPANTFTVVAASTGTNCPVTGTWTNYWYATAASGQRPRYQTVASLAPTQCVSARRSTGEDRFLPASVLFASSPPPTPTATITASPSSIPYLGTTTLTWSSTNATACLPTGAWASQVNIGTSGATNLNGLTQSGTYGVTCSGAAGTTPASANTSVTVGAAPPPPNVTLSIDMNPIVRGGSIRATWSSTNTTSCVTSFPYTPPPTPLNATNFVVGPFNDIGTFMIRVTCAGQLAGQSDYDEIPLVVTESDLVPSCWPHWADWLPRRAGGTGHVAWAKLQTANSNSYDVKATFFCPTPNGPKRYTYALDSSKMVDEGETEFNGGSYDEQAARENCVQNCVFIPEGSPLDIELDAFKELPANTLEILGVVGQ